MLEFVTHTHSIGVTRKCATMRLGLESSWDSNDRVRDAYTLNRCYMSVRYDSAGFGDGIPS